ncbi:MAG: hypothetical protein ACRDBO_04600 [Lachnospiraceae bacterium]
MKQKNVKDGESTFVVDCNSPIREVTHCGIGALYGITETIPEDIANLAAPLSPHVYTNPARAGVNYQQPTGAAIPTAERLTGTSAQVMIRLADVFPNWPYSFTNMEDWLLQVEGVITDKQNSTADNFYGYEIWNEPVYTWNEETNGSFDDMWLQTYQLIRGKEPQAKIIGPSEGYYDHDRMNQFLTFCLENNCIPDVICWHALWNMEAFAGHVQDYRALEADLGISPLPISINEYCDYEHEKEGCPGPSACYIAKFERYEIDNACISWWWTTVPGRLGSLLATDTQKGAGWWFYKWYGDMTGLMLTVTSPDENTTLVDGFACVDSDDTYISCLFGGDTSGDIDVTFTNLPEWIGETATIKMEAVDWFGKDEVSTGPYTISETDYEISNNAVTVSLTDCNNTSGYRIYMTPGDQQR